MSREDGEPPPYRRYKRVPTIGVPTIGVRSTRSVCKRVEVPPSGFALERPWRHECLLVENLEAPNLVGVGTHRGLQGREASPLAAEQAPLAGIVRWIHSANDD